MREEMMPTYAPPEHMVVTHGKGSYLFTAAGKKYLDFVSGIAVNAFGHANPELAQVLSDQASKLWHTSNMFRIPQAEALAKKITDNSFGERVFFANSGAEAVEAAIKTARYYHHSKGQPERKRIIGFESAFHGRTIATVAAARNKAHMTGFFNGDLDFDQVPFEDLQAIENTITTQTAAILLEPVQGEGGVRAFSNEFLKKLRTLCNDKGILLIFDEVQCGVGRTGKLFAYQTTDTTPDIMSLAKGLGGGFPIGACVTTAEVGDTMHFGTHGTTFGGNPLACAVGGKVIDMVLAPGQLEHIQSMTQVLWHELKTLGGEFPKIFGEVTGKGLMVGMVCIPENTQLLVAARDRGLLIAKSGGNKIRFLPPLNVSAPEIKEATTILKHCAQYLIQEDASLA